MKDSVNSLFQQRFQGHEMPVDPGVWAGIKGQIGPASTDGVSELFKQRFVGHEVPVDAAVWSGISSQLGHTAVVGSAAGSVLGWAAGVVAIALGTSIWLASGSPEPVDIAIVHQALVPEVEAGVPEQKVLATEVNEEPTRTNSGTHSSLGVMEKQPAGPTPKKVVQVINTGTSEPVRTDASSIGEQTTRTEVPGSENKPSVPPSTADGAAIVENIIQGMTAEVQQEATAAKKPSVTNKQEDPASIEESGLATPPERTEVPLPKLFMPNTFTPNGDGVNDFYEVGGVKAYGQVIIHVTSLKTGQTVFATNSGEPWYGNGCEDGMYLVALEALASDGRSATEGKVVWLNRSPMN